MLSRIVRVVAGMAILGVCVTVAPHAFGGAGATTTVYSFDPDWLNKVNSDGTGVVRPLIDYSDIDGQWPRYETAPHPSYQTHGPTNKRWFVSLAGGWIDPEETIWKQWVILRSDQGDKLPLSPVDPDIDSDSLYATADNGWQPSARWVPGTSDAEISLISHNSSTGATGVFALPIAFDASGNPSIAGPAYLKMATSEYTSLGVNGFPTILSVVGEYDWNPTGTAVVFRPNGYSGNSLADGLYTYTLTTAPSAMLRGPLFAGATSSNSWGATNKICFVTSGTSIRSISPDGTGVGQIVAAPKNTAFAYAHWSPDAARVMYRNWLTQGPKRIINIYTVASTGGTPSKLCDFWWEPIGWR